jgi:predicted phage tail protein
MSQKIVLTWVAPTTHIDGSAMPASEIANFRVYQSIEGSAFAFLGTAAANATSFEILDPAVGNYSYRVSAMDIHGRQSDFVAINVTVTPPLPAIPSPPSALMATVVSA